MTNEAKEKVLIEHWDMMWGLVHQFKNSVHDHDAEELFQEICTHVSYRLDEYDSKKAMLSTYIYRIARNKLINMVNSKKNMNVTPHEEEMVEQLLEEVTPYSPNESVALSIAYEIIDNHAQKGILMEVMRGTKQTVVAKLFDVSPQYVSKVFKDFVEEVKREL